MSCLIQRKPVLSPLFFPGLVQWWCAERVTGANNNGIDLSGNGNTATNVGGNAAVVPAVVNGRPVWRFNGVNSILTYPNFAPSDFTAFALLKTTNAVTAAGMICWVGNGAVNQIVVGNAAANISCYDGVGHPTSNIIDDFTNFSLVGVSCLAGSCIFYQNGANIGAPAAKVAMGALQSFGAIGVFFSVLDCAEAVFYTSALNTTQVAQLTEYFRERYNF